MVSSKVKKLKRLRTIAHKFFNGDKARRMIRDTPLQKTPQKNYHTSATNPD
jgi:hypothetical protein